MGVFDVPAGALIGEIAKELKGRIAQPKWAGLVKTGVNRERAPQNPDWYFVRTASVLYRVYTDGPVGTGSLRTYYGGRKRRGVRTEHFREAGGKIIRTCLQNLEKEGLIKKVEKGKGRIISAKGAGYLNRKANEVAELIRSGAYAAKAGHGRKGKSAEEESVTATLRGQEEAKKKKIEGEKKAAEKRHQAGAEKATEGAEAKPA
ncbi:MAG: 30S ribosomal protein S19e [Candidatus Diapherotrites archaeon]